MERTVALQTGHAVYRAAVLGLVTNTMKILITTDLFSSPANGVVTSVKNLREELAERGHEVRILTLSGSRISHKDRDVYYMKSVSLPGNRISSTVSVNFSVSSLQSALQK